jgi:predicted phage tail protein
VLRKEWRKRRIAANDNVRFVSYPLGGGNTGVKQIVGLVALIAVSAFALWAGPALFGAGTFGALATTAAIGIGGSLLINALVGPKPGARSRSTHRRSPSWGVY